MAARFIRVVVALFVSLSAAGPSAATAVVRPPTSQEIAVRPVPDRGADPVYASSYFGARYYRANLGRFTTVDPAQTISENLVDPQRWNRYAYVRNNPLKFTDPDGRNPVLVIAGAAWALYEIGSSIYDAYATYQTLRDPNASTAEKLTTGGLFAAGLLPGVPGGAAGVERAAIRHTDDAVDAVRQIHHIATDKSIKSGVTAAFERVFAKAGMNLQDPLNKVLLEGHQGRHSPEYHRHVLDTLRQATEGLSGKYYRTALEKALGSLRKELLENPDIVRGKGL